MSSNESRMGTVDESDHVARSDGVQFPPHSTQIASPKIDLNIDTGINEAVDGDDKSHGTNRRWSVDEEIILAESWATISIDSIVGTDQKGSKFWERITAYYNRHRPDNTPPRVWKRAKAHVYQFYTLVNEFSATINNLSNNRGSGWSDETVLEKTHEQWRHNNKVKKNKVFKYEHVWKVLKNSEKYVPQQADHNAFMKSRTIDLNEFTRGSSSSPSPNPDSTCELDDYEVRPRPIEQKAAKRKGKFKGKKNNGDDSQ
ncbi:hypothetical protein LXL04_034363 [Taraxacum kok-saghyz]